MLIQVTRINVKRIFCIYYYYLVVFYKKKILYSYVSNNSELCEYMDTTSIFAK